MLKAKILLVEDDPSLGYVITENLQQRGFKVCWCKDGIEASRIYQTENVDICLLDVMLPGKDGFSLAAEIRNMNSQVPILMLTARSMQEDKINGFQKGADDYIVKPFSMEELLLRIDVFLRRSNINTHLSQLQFSIGKFTFDFTSLELRSDSRTRILTQKEAELLKLLCNNQNRVLKREEILRSIWGDNDYFMGRSLDVFISRLRKYLKDDRGIEIQNYPRVGFKLIIQGQ